MAISTPLTISWGRNIRRDVLPGRRDVPSGRRDVPSGRRDVPSGRRDVPLERLYLFFRVYRTCNFQFTAPLLA
jgi:hypothetical protein